MTVAIVAVYNENDTGVFIDYVLSIEVRGSTRFNLGISVNGTHEVVEVGQNRGIKTERKY